MASVSRLLNHRGRNLQRLFISSLAHSFRHVRIYHLTRTTGEPEITASFLSSEFKSSRTGVNLWTHIKLQDGISWHHVYKLYFRPPYSKPKCIVKGVPKNVLFFLIVFLAISWRRYLENCSSKSFKILCGNRPDMVLFTHQISDNWDKPSPRYRRQKFTEKNGTFFGWAPFTYQIKEPWCVVVLCVAIDVYNVFHVWENSEHWISSSLLCPFILWPSNSCLSLILANLSLSPI